MELTALVIFLWVAAVCLHEFGHAITAYIAGDKSVKDKGYLTLNPIVYFNSATTLVLPVLILLLGGVPLPGAAVYVNRGAIKSKVWHSLVSLAGPLFSMLALILLLVAFQFMTPEWTAAGNYPYDIIYDTVSLLIYLQIYVTIINLLPLPPLDGYGIIEPWLPKSMQAAIAEKANLGFFILILLFWYCEPFADFIRGIAIELTRMCGVNMRVAFHALKELDDNKWPLIGVLLVAWIVRSKLAPPAEQADKLYSAGKPQEALPLYEKALEKNARDSRALLGSASCLLNIGQTQKALERADQLLKLEPNNNRALALQAACYTNTGRHEESIAAATRALENPSDFPTPFPYLVLAMSQTELRRFNDALESINKYLVKEPENHQALFIKGTVLEELGRYDEALDTYSKAARSRDGHIRGCIARGILLCALGRIDEGLAEFHKVLPHEVSIRTEELAKLKLLLAEAAIKYDESGRSDRAGHLREASARIT